MIKEGFSIVLCTFNGEQRLERTLTHIAALELPEGIEVELVLVNNGSTDNTVSFTKNMWLKLKEPFLLRIINENRPGKGHAIEAGYDAAQYAYIVTVDDDNWINSKYLIVALEIINNNPKIGLAGGRGIAVFEDKQPVWFESFQTSYAVGKPIPHTGFYPKERTWVWGAGMILRKQLWDTIRKAGFSFITSKSRVKAVGEDTELALTMLYLGYQHYFDERLIFHHYMPAGRTTWQNCINMFDGFAKTSIYIKLYGYVGDRIKANKPATTSHYLFLLTKNNIQGFLDRSKIKYYFNNGGNYEGDRGYIGYRQLIVFWKAVLSNIMEIDRCLKKINSCYLKLNDYRVMDENHQKR